MDTKLARGLTREGFRRDLKNLDGVQTDLSETRRPYIEKLITRGKLSKPEVREALSRVAAFKNHPHHTVFLERFTNPRVKSLSPDFDGAIVGGNFSSGPITLFGHDETVRSYSLFYDRFSKKRIDLRLMERPIYVREHAVSRFIERSDFPFASVTTSLWPGLLLIDALEFFTAPAIARPFMLPVPQGVFLGVSALGTPPGDIKGIERATITPSGVDESFDPPAYVSRQEEPHRSVANGIAWRRLAIECQAGSFPKGCEGSIRISASRARAREIETMRNLPSRPFGGCRDRIRSRSHERLPSQRPRPAPSAARRGSRPGGS